MATKKTTTVVETQTVTAPAGVSTREDNFAIAGFIVGIVSLCAWFLPCIGFPVTITGLVLSIMGLKSKKNKTFAIVGVVLCGLGLLASIINAAAGAYLSATGQYDLLN